MANPRNTLAAQFGHIASEAGRVIVAAQRSGLRVEAKPDGSPVSDADTSAERLIRSRLAALLPDVPIVAEESFAPCEGPAPGQFLLVDPLDGTRDFIVGGDEYTVNIALIEDGAPVAGCVYAPARRLLYVAGAAAFMAEVQPGHVVAAVDYMSPIRTQPYPAGGLRALASKSHLDATTDALLRRLGPVSRAAIGSSLKFCLLAQGEADVYPRLAPTMEWDTAAGHAVLVAAGGSVLAPDGAPLRYGKPGFRNAGFVAWAREPVPA